MEQKSIKLLHGVYISDLLNTLGLRCYPLIAPEKAGLNYIVYQRESLEYLTTKGRPHYSPTQATYSIIVVSDSYSWSLLNAEKIISLLMDYSDTEVADIQILNCRESFTSDSYLQEIQIKIITN